MHVEANWATAKLTHCRVGVSGAWVAADINTSVFSGCCTFLSLSRTVVFAVCTAVGPCGAQMKPCAFTAKPART